MNEILGRWLSLRSVFAIGLGLLAANALAVIVGQLLTHNNLSIFGSFWASGLAANQGANPYAIYPLVFIPDTVIPPLPEVNLNPPAVLPLFQLFALFSPQTGRIVWLLLSFAIYVWCVLFLHRKLNLTQLQALWLLAWPPAVMNLNLGQIYALLFLLGTGIWFAVRSGRPVLVAVCVGILVAIKPNFAVWGLLAFAAGHYRPAILAGLFALAVTLLAVVAYGPEVYQQWLAAAAADHHNLFPHDVSFRGLFYRMGYPNVAFVPAGIVLLAGAIWAVWSRPTLYRLTPVALLVSMLCAPLAWFDYILVAVPFVVDRKWTPWVSGIAVFTFTEGIWPQLIYSSGWAVLLASIAAATPVVALLLIFLRGDGAEDATRQSAAVSDLRPG